MKIALILLLLHLAMPLSAQQTVEIAGQTASRKTAGKADDKIVFYEDQGLSTLDSNHALKALDALKRSEAKKAVEESSAQTDLSSQANSAKPSSYYFAIGGIGFSGLAVVGGILSCNGFLFRW